MAMILDTTIQFNDALLTATDAALAAYPQAETHIRKGLALVQANAITDCCRLERGWWTVRSAQRPDALYNVRLVNGARTCTCADYACRGGADGLLCKHLWAVLLVRKARTGYTAPVRRRHAYHLITGEEGHARLSHDGQRAQFWAGGGRRSVWMDAADLQIGPWLARSEQ